MNDDSVDMNKVIEATQRGQLDEDGMTLDLMKMQDTSEHPWERQPGEPNLWYDRFFRHYLKQVEGKRNIVEACRRSNKESEPKDRTQATPFWNQMAYQWNWQVRAEAYDEYARLKDHLRWEARRAELREKEWHMSSELLTVAEDHITKIRSSQAQPDIPAGTPGRVQLPRVRVKNQDAARFAELGSKLGRLATGMATEQVAVNVQVKVEETRKKRWDSALPQLQQILDGEIEIIEDGVVDEPPEELGETPDESAN